MAEKAYGNEYSSSHIEELTKITDSLKKFKAQDFKKCKEIIHLLEKYNSYSLLWIGAALDVETLCEMLSRCIFFTEENVFNEKL